MKHIKKYLLISLGILFLTNLSAMDSSDEYSSTDDEGLSLKINAEKKIITSLVQLTTQIKKSANCTEQNLSTFADLAKQISPSMKHDTCNSSMQTIKNSWKQFGKEKRKKIKQDCAGSIDYLSDTEDYSQHPEGFYPIVRRDVNWVLENNKQTELLDQEHTSLADKNEKLYNTILALTQELAATQEEHTITKRALAEKEKQLNKISTFNTIHNHDIQYVLNRQKTQLENISNKLKNENENLQAALKNIEEGRKGHIHPQRIVILNAEKDRCVKIIDILKKQQTTEQAVLERMEKKYAELHPVSYTEKLLAVFSWSGADEKKDTKPIVEQ